MSRLAAGAAHGAASAAIYSAVELAAIQLAPFLGVSQLDAPRMLAGYLLLHGAAAVALGAGIGAALGTLFRSGVYELATLAVVLAHAGHLVRISTAGPRLALALGVCAVVAGCLVRSALRPDASARLRFVANPWSASLLVIGGAALLLDPSSPREPAAASAVALAWMLCVGVLLFAANAVLSLASSGVRRPHPLRSLGVAGLALLTAAATAARTPDPAPPLLPSSPETRGDRPDVVLISLDTVRSDHLSVYGYERDTTRNLEVFARGATRYTRAVAASNLTLPTHASLFTGLYMRHHGARPDPHLGSRGLDERFETLAEKLRDAGYLTLGVVGNPGYLRARLGFGQGFDHYDETHPTPFFPMLRRYFLAASLDEGLARIVTAPDTFERAETAYRRAEVINRSLFGLLEHAAGRSQPLFLFVNYMDAHWPYDPPPPFDERYPGRLSGDLRPGKSEFVAAHRLEAPLTPRQWRHMVSQYDGELAYLDQQLGKLFERLRATGRWDQALIVITSDHGEALGDHGLLAHGVSLHQHQVHVPLLIKFPGQRDGEVSDVLTGSIDILPTILGVVGLAVPDALPGVDLRAAAPQDRIVFSESHPWPGLRGLRQFRHEKRAVFAGDVKLIASESGDREFFDLSIDPEELRDRAAEDPRAAELEQRLEAWLQARPAASGSKVPLDAETRARLEALGYGQ